MKKLNNVMRDTRVTIDPIKYIIYKYKLYDPIEQTRAAAAQQQAATCIWLLYLLVPINIQEVQQHFKNILNILAGRRKENQEKRFTDDATGSAQTDPKKNSTERGPAEGFSSSYKPVLRCSATKLLSHR